MSAMHGKAGYNGAEKRALSKYIIAIVAIVAAIACCAVLLAALPGCGGDMLATTTQAQSGSQAASGADSASAEAQATSASAASADEIQVVVEFDCANAHAYNAKFPETLGTFSVNIPKDGTVFDALVATGVEYGLRGKDYVSSIGGIEDKVCGRDSGWLYLVDGKRPVKTAMEYKLVGGENVRWAYTVTEGDVEVTE